MILPRPEEAKHKYQLYRLLRAILENNYLANTLMFKGGTYAAMRGLLTRFSVDLDWDLVEKSEKGKVRSEIEKIVKELKLGIKDQSKDNLQFFLSYPALENERNTLKLEITDLVSPKNEYEEVNLGELNMLCRGQTVGTMVANKLWAASARYTKTGHLAGRDYYDLHEFLRQGLPVRHEVVEERAGIKYERYLEEMTDLIRDKVTEEMLYQDLNALLPAVEMKRVVKHLREELLVFLADESERSKDGKD